MARWLVEVHGDIFDLEEYPYWFPDGDLHAVRLGDAIFLTGTALEVLPDATSVRAAAGEAHRAFSAIISLLWPSLRPTTVGAVYREEGDGSRSAWAFPEGVAARSKARGRLSGGPSGDQKTEAQTLFAAADENHHLHMVLLLWAAPDPSWPTLYRILEELEAAMGRSLAALGFCNVAERNRFRHTANNAEAAGTNARHRLGHSRPPHDPMSLSEAQRFISMLIQKVLHAPRTTAGKA